MRTLHFLPFSIRPPTFSPLTHKKNGISTFFQTPPISFHSKHFLSPLPHPNNNNPFSSSPLSMASAPSSTSSQSVAPGDVDSSADFHQLVQAHQAAAARLPPLEEIRTLLDRSTRGMLSTFSQKHEGYPSGSMVDFACDHDGFPILAVSSLAVHTKDLLANPKCSLLVANDPKDRTDLIITLHGDAISVAESNRVAVRTAYLRRHPNAFWVDFGDFQFMCIEPKVVRYVSGVATALLGSGEFGTDEYKAAKVYPINQFSAPLASHMNKDHAEDTKAIVQHSTSVQVDFAHMLDLDSLGFYVKSGDIEFGLSLRLWINFPIVQVVVKAYYHSRKTSSI